MFAIVLVLIGRTIAIYVSLAPLKGFLEKWKVIINWGGLKGSLSIALALSLPHSFSGRENILVLTFSVVLFSLLFQGLTLNLIIKKMTLAPCEERTKPH
ncbi:NhaP-type Na+/H+ or K+/H+ antiporter [Paenibacillus turicensis]|uniref:NhaP-type Na+/H+ or K+/H+ antiporter n=1 Tax=Paenibacillus turicensis TaxID=160487 RepID=A0ABS4FQL7_9BACL|nr:NhaP-type Na+/H+ or K+/H+ antiporter [Paenibacillus turicensis]